MASLKAEGERGQVRLRWETANEVGVAGFHVLRAESADGPYVRVNKRLVAAEGRPGANQRYQFVDKTARPGRTWWYRLVEVEEGGRRTEYPEIVSATAEGSGLYDLLPEAVRGLLSS